MKSLINNNSGSVNPLVLFIITIFGAGALYTLFFIEIAFPVLMWMLPNDAARIYIMMVIYAVPAIIIFVGILVLFLNGLKRTMYVRGD
jgi:hypothetical protein